MRIFGLLVMIVLLTAVVCGLDERPLIYGDVVVGRVFFV